MDNIIEYITKYGDFDFDDREFGEVDSLVLSQMSYWKFEKLGAAGAGLSLNELSRCGEAAVGLLFDKLHNEKRNRELFFAAAASKRFGPLKSDFYVSSLDAEIQKQFAAVTFIGPLGAYISFRGTDDTLVGWKEDFNMTFMSGTPAQLCGVDYLLDVCRKLDGALLLGGHSKGGNIAEYAAIACPRDVETRIAGVYNHDGPGFRPEVYELEGYRAVAPKVHKSVPKSSLIGMLLEQREAYKIVESSRVGIMQHDPFSWKTEGFGFVLCDELSGTSRHMKKTINDWLLSIDDKSRKLFIDTVYSIITTTNVTSFSELRNNWVQCLKVIRRQTADLDEETKRFVLQTLKDFARTFGTNLRPHKGDDKQIR